MRASLAFTNASPSPARALPSRNILDSLFPRRMANTRLVIDSVYRPARYCLYLRTGSLCKARACRWSCRCPPLSPPDPAQTLDSAPRCQLFKNMDAGNPRKLYLSILRQGGSLKIAPLMSCLGKINSESLKKDSCERSHELSLRGVIPGTQKN